MPSVNEAIQAWIFLAGGASVVLANAATRRVSRWACIAGLLAQPGFLWSTWAAGQMGMFCLAVVYTAGWAMGVWNFWIRPEPELGAENPPNTPDFSRFKFWLLPD